MFAHTVKHAVTRRYSHTEYHICLLACSDSCVWVVFWSFACCFFCFCFCLFDWLVGWFGMVWLVFLVTHWYFSIARALWHPHLNIIQLWVSLPVQEKVSLKHASISFWKWFSLKRDYPNTCSLASVCMVLALHHLWPYTRLIRIINGPFNQSPPSSFPR